MEPTVFFEALRNGDYACVPTALRELFILAVNNQDQPALTVCRYERPTLVEDAVYKYRLQGIEIELMIKDIEKAESIFTHFYKINISVPAFLGNLNIFYKVSATQLEARYGNTAMSLDVALAKRRGARRNRNDDNQEEQDPRKLERLLFIRKIGEVWKPKKTK